MNQTIYRISVFLFLLFLTGCFKTTNGRLVSRWVPVEKVDSRIEFSGKIPRKEDYRITIGIRAKF